MKKISVRKFNAIVLVVEIIMLILAITFWVLVFMALIKFIKGI